MQPLVINFSSDLFLIWGPPPLGRPRQGTRQFDIIEDLGVKREAVNRFRMRGRIPPRYWAGLVKSAADRNITGITFERVAELHCLPPFPHSDTAASADSAFGSEPHAE